MNKDHIRYLPIKEGDQLLAVISFHDVANAVIKGDELSQPDAEELHQELAGGGIR
jgi:hypothetical protein